MARLRTPLGILRYKPVFLYEGRNVINKEIALKNLGELTILFREAGIQTGPVFGSLLGMIRENDFISWDEDVDMYILKEQEDDFLSLLWKLRDHGFELVRYDKRGLYSLMKDGEYVDYYVFRSISSELRHNGGPGFILEKYFKDVVHFDFKGVDLTVPRESEELLAFTYGDNWRTPMRYFYTPSPAALVMKKIKWSLKCLVPLAIYPSLVRIFRKKDLERFLQKCSEKGIELKETPVL